MTFAEALLGLIASATAVGVLGLVLVIFAVAFLFLAHRSPGSPINFAHTLQDRDGRTSLRKLGEWMTLLSSTWIVVFLATVDRLPEMVFILWLLAWVARAAIGPILGAKADVIATAARGPTTPE